MNDQDRRAPRPIANSLNPDQYCSDPRRLLAMYSASVALAEQPLQAQLINLAQARDIDRSKLYEVVLQSYLFLGFPRMLQAAEILAEVWPDDDSAKSQLNPVSEKESKHWFESGVDLCQRVYGHNYDHLRGKVEQIAPEIFRWMIVEGYGKVLSRPELDPITRELAIVACLMVDNRPRQMHSHIRGALNVGCSVTEIGEVILDVSPIAPAGAQAGQDILESLATE